jgi:hypothetical protein
MSYGAAVADIGTPAAGINDMDEVPQVVASYAGYLRTRTRAEPQISVTGFHAEVSAAVREKTLVLAFSYRSGGWSLEGAEIRHGETTTAFGRRELARAVAALLSHAR